MEAHLRKLAATGLPCIGEIRAPWPKGDGVPYADVAAVLSLFQELDLKEVRLEGAAPPLTRKEGGGWSFEK